MDRPCHFQRLPRELSLEIYRLVDDKPVAVRCNESRHRVFLVAREERRFGMAPRTVMTLSGVSHLTRRDIGQIFTAGQFGMEAIFSISRVLFKNSEMMTRFANQNPQMARVVRVGIIFNWARLLGDWLTLKILCYWLCNLSAGIKLTLHAYPRLSRIEAVPGELGNTAGSRSHPTSGYQVKQESVLDSWDTKEPLSVVVYTLP